MKILNKRYIILIDKNLIKNSSKNKFLILIIFKLVKMKYKTEILNLKSFLMSFKKNVTTLTMTFSCCYWLVFNIYYFLEYFFSQNLEKKTQLSDLLNIKFQKF